MRPTVYVLMAIGVVLAVSAALLYRNPDQLAGRSDASALVLILVVAAAGTAVLAWVLLRFGGKGYTETMPPRRR